MRDYKLVFGTEKQGKHSPVSIDGNGSEYEIPLRDGIFVIGRNPENEITIPSYCADVSNIHCRIYRDGDNLHLEDTSRNGTFLNDNKVGESQIIRIQPGSRIRLGSAVCLLLRCKGSERRGIGFLGGLGKLIGK